MANQIHLIGEFRREEAVASGEVKPGMLLEITSDDEVKAHATEGGYAERAFAVEDALQGNTVDDAYDDDDLVEYNIVAPGSEVQALLKAGENVVIGTKLISSGTGLLIAEASADSSTTVKQIIAVAREAKDLTASGAVNTLIAVRVY